MNVTRRSFLKTSAAAAALTAAQCAGLGGKMKQPNLVLILVDDMGYSDLGAFGSTINTPNLNRMAREGMKYTQFYNCSRCCPARASLLTGLYPHQAGMGWMVPINMGLDGYEGNLNSRCRTIAEVLKPAGYSAYHSGKWHVSRGNGETEGLTDSRPHSRGFDRVFEKGNGSYWRGGRLDGEKLEHEPGTFYDTDAITDYACQFISEHHQKTPDKPFFQYVAYTAPHWPLHAHREDIEKYRGKFSKGWDVLREEKYETMQSLKLLRREWDLSARDPEVDAWDSLSKDQKEDKDLRMAIYAAQLDCMDRGVGKIMQTLEKNGVADDTLVLFLSDNGGCHEEIHWKTPALDKIGTDESFESYGRPWANYSNAPFREFKSWVHEGGIATPLIARWPNGITAPEGTINHASGHITDIMATFVELAGATYPAGGDDNVHDLVGTSLVPTFSGGDHKRGEIFWEHEANRALRDGTWKLVAKGIEGPWELYDMDTDRTEQRDLAGKDGGRVKKMADRWDEIAKATNVYPLDGRLWGERMKAFKKKK